MRARTSGIAAAAAAALVLLLSSPLAFAQSSGQYTLKDLNEQTVMALDWFQTSAEYRELCYQAYNIADMMVNKAVAEKSAGSKPLAIVADLDETLINNSAYDAGLIGRNAAYSSKTWLEWEKAALAKALPGAADFLHSVANKGVAVFYVTNRDEAGLSGTLENLRKLGYPDADSTHVLVKTNTSNKQPRFDSITQNYHVVVYMGDNANDLPIGTYGKNMQDRNAVVDQNSSKFGTQFIALPNPIYGDWEGALAKGYWGLSPKGKDEARKSDLNTWVPPQN